MKKIIDILAKYNVDKNVCQLYGDYIAKLNVKKPSFFDKNKKLVLVTATSPTPQGEGKTTVAINLTDALNKLGKKACAVLREPSIGPCFGTKGGAAGAGKAKVLPEEVINMHFTGDIHALTTANNLICAVIDNHIFQGNYFKINPNKIKIKRVIDMNDRSLRDITIRINENISYQTSFDITAACELMSIFCLSKSKDDFINRVNSMVVAFDKKNKPITVKQFNITNAIVDIMKDCFMPNAVQTLEGNLAIVSGGPFANISIGVSSVFGLNVASQVADYIITEAGFGSELGLEKFIDIVMQENDLPLKCIVLVSTIKSLVFQGNGAITKGIVNLQQHIDNLKNYKVPFVVAINKFDDDKKQDLQFVLDYLKKNNIIYCLNTGYADGAKGGIDLAKIIVRFANKSIAKPQFIYQTKESVKTKVTKIVNKVYGIDQIVWSNEAQSALTEQLDNLNFYVCLSKDPKKIYTDLNQDGKPCVKIQEIQVDYGAKLIVVLCNKVFRMPGLGTNPRAQNWK